MDATDGLSATGQSESWQAAKRNVLRIFELFRDSSEERRSAYAQSFDKLSEKVVTTNALYEGFAN